MSKKSDKKKNQLLQKFQNSSLLDIVIPVYNGPEYLGSLLSDLMLQMTETKFDVWIADDNSPDSRISAIGKTAAQESNYHYYKNNQQCYFAKNCNISASKGKAKYICFLNTDIKPINNWIDSLINVLETNDNVGMVAPLLLFFPDTDIMGPRGTVQSAGFAFNAMKLPWHRLITFNADHPRVLKYRDDLQGATGACFITRRDLWNRVGGFFEGYISSFEDVEYGIRIKELGYDVAYQPEAKLYHRVGGSNAQDPLLLQRNSRLFLNRVNHLIKYDEHKVL